MHASWRLSLPHDVTLLSSADGRFEFSGPLGQFTLRWKDGIVRQPLSRLAENRLVVTRFIGSPAACGGRDRMNAVTTSTVGQLLDSAEVAAEPHGASRLIRFLQHLARCGLLEITACEDDVPLATLMPRSAAFSLSDGAMPAGTVMLSRFASLRRWDDGLAVESPLSFARLLLHDERAVRLVHRLASPLTVEEAAGGLCGLSPEWAEPLLQMLDSAGALTAVGADGVPAEEEHDSLKYWEFHDLLFHASSREGRYDGPVGAAFPWAHVADPLPAVPDVPRDSGAAIDLFRPDLEQLAEHDIPFSRVMEQRRSIREYGGEPLTAGQLGEFLFRVGRVREQFRYEFDLEGGPVEMDFAPRPYPSAGGVYELELYPLVHRCGGLDAGLYHYDALAHRLTPIAASESHRRQLLGGAADAAGMEADELQVLLIVSARFPRMMWKYSGMAYAAILKDVGVVYQTMYLTAAAMGLAPCGLGCGDSDLFARTVGSDYYAETSVGEFLLGSR